MEPCLGFRELTVGLEGSVYNGDFRNPLCIGGVGLLPAKGHLVSVLRVCLFLMLCHSLLVQ